MPTNFPGGLDNFNAIWTTAGAMSEEHTDAHANMAAALNAMQSGILGPVTYNVKAYGAKGDGVTDDTAALQSCATAAAANEVYVPAGIYMLHLAAHPADGTYQVGLVLRSGTRLRFAPGAVFKLMANQPSGHVIMNFNIGVGGDENIVLEDVVIDGNNANQTNIHNGVTFLRTRGVKFNRVLCKNLRGTATSGANENFFFEVQLSGDVSFTDCTALCTTGSSSSGFSADTSTNVVYSGCRAIGMSVANGFTHNTCRSVSYVNCDALLNANIGFNSELSTDVTYAGCVGGGQAVTSASSPYPYTTGQSLGNLNGFLANGSSRVLYTGCVASKNSGTGLITTGTAGAVRVEGGAFCDNSAYGISMQDATSGLNFRAHGLTMSGNTTANVHSPQGDHSGFGFVNPGPSVPASGTSVSNQLGFDAMLLVGGGTVSNIAINSAGNLGLTSGWFKIPAGGNVTPTYSVAPTTWFWFVD